MRVEVDVRPHINKYIYIYVSEISIEKCINNYYDIIFMYIYVHTYVFMDTYVHTYVFMDMYVHMYVFMDMYVHMYVFMDMYVHMYVLGQC